MKDKVLFDVHTLAYSLHSLKSTLSLLRLQKSFYFLFAYYGGFYRMDAMDTIVG